MDTKPVVFDDKEWINDPNWLTSPITNNISTIDNNTFNVASIDFNIEGDTNVKIGDFEIKAKDLGKLLEKFAKQFMPEVLI